MTITTAGEPFRSTANQTVPEDLWRTALAIGVPVLFNIGFTVLSVRFSYPDILREPSATVLTRFHQQSGELLPGWYTMFFAATLFIPMGILIADRLLSGTTARIAALIGGLAGLVQAIGLSRWIFLVPMLAARFTGSGNENQRSVYQAIFEAFHQWAGVGLGEHLGYLLTSVWTLLIITGLWRRSRPLAITGIAFTLMILTGLLEPFGVSMVGAINAIGYLLWSLWMIALGIYLQRIRG